MAMRRAHYIIRVGFGAEDLAPNSVDDTGNQWFFLLGQNLGGFPRDLPQTEPLTQFEADLDNPHVSVYVYFLSSWNNVTMKRFIEAGIARRNLGNGPNPKAVVKGNIPVPMEMTMRLQQNFGHWFDWDPVDGGEFRKRVRALQGPPPSYSSMLQHVTAGHDSFKLFEGLFGYQVESHTTIAPPASLLPPTLPSTLPPNDPPLVQHDLENEVCEHSNPHGNGYIYLIHMCGTPFLKIGMSLDPETRLRTLQTGNPCLLQIINTWAVGDMRTVELSLHQQFAAKRVENESVREWFDFSLETASGVGGLVEDMNRAIGAIANRL